MGGKNLHHEDKKTIVAVFALSHKGQNLIIYMNWLNRLPFETSNLSDPTQYGFSRNRVRNVKLFVDDEVSLGLWHIIPENLLIDREKRSESSIIKMRTEINQEFLQYYDEDIDKVYDEALARANHVFVYLHGNAQDRSAKHRVGTYNKILNHFENSHVIAFDYRGFGDSSGEPSEIGLVDDSVAVIEWVLKRIPNASKIYILAHSLGSAVGAQAVRKLEQKYINIGGVAQLVMDYGGFPLLRPFSSFIGFQSILKNMIHVKFNTEEIIGTLKCPILLIHGQVDAVIPAAQSKNLFMKILNTTDVIKPSKYQEYQYSEGSLFVSLSNQAQYLQLNHASHNDIHEHDITWKIIKNTILQ
ncbi:alpha/beta-hydrolase [Rozella allomycis CSF55]|uniref:Alpha/beta-hydrolase n=1 Tax=Rozella allomycis (strain CSF55) TaxID=988480 RepID=A0A075B1X2_ROZAC|nr:Monoacylglycerol lipase protein ABHD12 domain-containing protein [Rozella allomycis CSF55]RKP21668.1 alpha/beta-hydrolase [Rozella allomycis CSF55]|eukprot:EPZ34798.1 Monoacylglycerol lipase protein ABHD12 domain-containing protein [Rozella allomycis CSF55]